MKKILMIALCLPFISFAQTKTTTKKKTKSSTNTVKSSTSTVISTVTNTVATAISSTDKGIDISAGLKEALNKGITQQVSKLALTDGFYKNEAVKILMPPEFASAENTLRKLGFSHLADEGIKSMNRAAEDAVKQATPIFVDAIKNMSITDAKNILLGSDNSATVYLQTATTKALNSKLQPIIEQSVSKVGADLVWNSIVTKYNSIPLMNKVNPDISSYITDQTLKGVFKMIAVEEKNIRTDLNSRTSNLLQQVFAMQDNK